METAHPALGSGKGTGMRIDCSLLVQMHETAKTWHPNLASAVWSALTMWGAVVYRLARQARLGRELVVSVGRKRVDAHQAQHLASTHWRPQWYERSYESHPRPCAEGAIDWATARFGHGTHQSKRSRFARGCPICSMVVRKESLDLRPNPSNYWVSGQSRRFTSHSSDPSTTGI